MTASEVARWLGCHVNTVKRLPPEELPFFRLGSRGDRRYDLEDVRLYVSRRLVGGTGLAALTITVQDGGLTEEP